MGTIIGDYIGTANCYRDPFPHSLLSIKHWTATPKAALHPGKANTLTGVTRTSCNRRPGKTGVGNIGLH